MYVFLIEDDNSIFASRKEAVMQREKLVNDIWFLIPPKYNENNMSLFSATLEYILPVSRRYKTAELVKDPKGYKEYCKYVVPLDTDLTSEAGDMELQLSLVFVGLDADGKSVQKVRKTKPTKLHITPIAAWSDIIPDSALSALDQRIIKTDAQIKALGDYADVLAATKADNIKYNNVKNTIRLMSGNSEIGDEIAIKTCECNIGEGLPIIDFNLTSENPGGGQQGSANDNVIEF